MCVGQQEGREEVGYLYGSGRRAEGVWPPAFRSASPPVSQELECVLWATPPCGAH